MHNYKELKVWQKAMDLVENIYVATATFPETEKYGLTNQIRRSAVSVPSNIAEGAGRNGNREFNQFIGIAAGSICELETQLLISKRLKYVNENNVLELIENINEIQKMLSSLSKSSINTISKN